MDATDLQYLDDNPAVDIACRLLIQYAREANERRAYGKTGVTLHYADGEYERTSETRDFTRVDK